jgi:hypothetical protein
MSETVPKFKVILDDFCPKLMTPEDLRESFYRCKRRVEEAKNAIDVATMYAVDGSVLHSQLRGIQERISALEFDDSRVS